MNRITMDDDRYQGRPCIRGLPIRVVDVLDLLARGRSRDEILAELPVLEPEDIAASLQYASRHLEAIEMARIAIDECMESVERAGRPVPVPVAGPVG
jgi:uncharacterized protein (DUF433 family)